MAEVETNVDNGAAGSVYAENIIMYNKIMNMGVGTSWNLRP